MIDISKDGMLPGITWYNLRSEVDQVKTENISNK